MSKFISISLGLLVLLTASPTFADPRGWHGGWHGEGWHHEHFGPGDLFWGGVLGGFLGSVFAPRVEEAPPPPPVEREELVPGSSEWLDFCTRRYKSFDPQSGTYLGFDGVRHPC